MYHVGLAYFFWLISGFGALGFHRMYLGKYFTGLLYFFTGGLFMVGSVYDFLTLPLQVNEANLRLRLYGRPGFPGGFFTDAPREASWPRHETPERVVLRVAKKNNGMASPAEVALEGGITVDEARKYLEKLASKGYAEVRVKKTGVIVYVFSEFVKRPMDDEFERF